MPPGTTVTTSRAPVSGHNNHTRRHRRAPRHDHDFARSPKPCSATTPVHPRKPSKTPQNTGDTAARLNDQRGTTPVWESELTRATTLVDFGFAAARVDTAPGGSADRPAGPHLVAEPRSLARGTLCTVGVITLHRGDSHRWRGRRDRQRRQREPARRRRGRRRDPPRGRPELPRSAGRSAVRHRRREAPARADCRSITSSTPSARSGTAATGATPAARLLLSALDRTRRRARLRPRRVPRHLDRRVPPPTRRGRRDGDRRHACRPRGAPRGAGGAVLALRRRCLRAFTDALDA